MSINAKLAERSGGNCELCNSASATIDYTVSPKSEDPQNQVAICDTCFSHIVHSDASEYWRCLEGSVWNPEPAVQALSYRLLHLCKHQEWVNDVLGSIELEDSTTEWALSAFEVAETHKDAFGNVLENGDTVILTQALNVKGTSFSAAKGTVVKKIRLVSNNTEQIEGKINEQTIVILTKYVKKN